MSGNTMPAPGTAIDAGAVAQPDPALEPADHAVDLAAGPARTVEATQAMRLPDPATAPGRRRLARLRVGLGRLVRAAVMIALFVGGIALGHANVRPSTPVAAPAGDPATVGVLPAPAVQELVAALLTNDADRVRAAVPAEPYTLLTSEMQRWDFETVSTVETLSTLVDGPRSSTAMVLIGRTTTGNPVNINLVVHTVDGQIVSFR